MDMPQHDLHGAVSDIVQKLPIMGNQHQRTLVSFQIVFKPFYGFYVQMVCRLVQKQDIRLRQQDLGQFYAHVPALAESLRRPGKFFSLEAETQQRLFCRDTR